jgi:peptide/nickel transport system permease protein
MEMDMQVENIHGSEKNPNAAMDFTISLLYFVVRKIIRLLLLIGAVAILSYTLMCFSPVDPIDAYLGPAIMRISPHQREVIAQRWGLHQPPLERLARWAHNVAQGDLGISTIYNEPVRAVIGKRFATSSWLMAIAWTCSGVLGFGLGIVAGVHRDSLLDRSIRLYAYIVASTPTFWIGMLMLTLFSIYLGWAPICCAWPVGSTPEEATVLQRLHHLMLPAATLTLVGIAPIALHTREKTVEAMHSDYALFARALGEREWGIAIHHALRNLTLPAITLQFASMGELFGGAILAEQVFAYPGLGKATVEAGYRGDIPLLLGIALCTTIFVFIGNTLADLIYLLIDPRMRQRRGWL